MRVVTMMLTATLIVVDITGTNPTGKAERAEVGIMAIIPNTVRDGRGQSEDVHG